MEGACSSSGSFCFLWYCAGKNYRKIINIGTPESFAVIILKFDQGGY